MDKIDKEIEYFDTEKHEVLENKTMIHIFERTWWFKHLKWWKGYAKEYYTYEEYENIITVKKKANISGSQLKDSGVQGK